MVAAPTDGKLSKAEKKALKAAKKAMKAGGGGGGDAKAEKKRLKKEAKKAAAAAAAAEGQQQDEKKKEKKDKDKKSKRERDGGDGAAAPAVASAAAAAADGHGDGGGKKKQKHAAAAPTGRAAYASVGDAALAASSPAILKDLYEEDPAVASMAPSARAAAREERRTAVEGCDLAPVLTFAQTGLAPELLHATREFATPSPIQAQCWPIILSGRDLIGIAATGSGKTLGFGLPMLAHIAANRRPGGAAAGRKGPFAVVLAPTRELALQIAAVLEDAGARCGVRTVCVYGGVPKGPQVSALRAGVEVVVGTPGRLEDLMGEGAAKLTVRAVCVSVCVRVCERHALVCVSGARAVEGVCVCVLMF